jgi:hypothetical protein
MINTELFKLTDSQNVKEGLQKMAESLCPIDFFDAEQWVAYWVEVPQALFLVEVMKRAEDRAEWFPHGKWATIQSFQDRIDKAITGYLSTPVVKS